MCFCINGIFMYGSDFLHLFEKGEHSPPFFCGFFHCKFTLSLMFSDIGIGTTLH